MMNPDVIVRPCDDSSLRQPTLLVLRLPYAYFESTYPNCRWKLGTTRPCENSTTVNPTLKITA